MAGYEGKVSNAGAQVVKGTPQKSGKQPTVKKGGDLRATNPSK